MTIHKHCRGINTNGSLDVDDYYTKSQINSQMNTKADKNATADNSLSNLSANGQMIINSQNGTISNCVLEIPQNLKLTLENNVLTKKAGSTTVLYGETYRTRTNNSDISRTLSGISEGKYVIFDETSNSLATPRPIGRVYSGTEFPTLEYNNLNTFYNVSEKKLYGQTSTGWTEKTSFSYPLCIVDADSLGNVSFAKDSNGNDMIFNGAGFIGHHAFVYPNTKGLFSNGIDTDGTLKSTVFVSSSLQILDMNIYNNSMFIVSNTTTANRIDLGECENLDELPTVVADSHSHYIIYVKSINTMYYNPRGQGWQSQQGKYLVFLHYTYDGTTVTDFTIRQPVRTATVEMVNKALGDIDTALSAIIGV